MIDLNMLFYYLKCRVRWDRTKDIRRLQLPVYLVEEWVDAIRGKTS